MKPHYVCASEILLEESMLDLFGGQPHETERMGMMRLGRT
jgi:hypothetical protein